MAVRRVVKRQTTKVVTLHQRHYDYQNSQIGRNNNWVSDDPTVSVNISGGIGNVLFQTIFAIAYAMKHGIKYYIPPRSRNSHSNSTPFEIVSTGVPQKRTTGVREQKDADGFPFYEELPLYPNPVFHGYWQTFNYGNPYRDEILKILNFPNKIKAGVVSIHVRRSDAIHQVDTFPMLLKQYYDDAIAYINKKGHFNFCVYSDDIPFTKTWFNHENYPECNFDFSIGKTDYEDLVSLMNCEHHIVARSTFSYMGAWLCSNTDKIVCCPPFPLFKHCHRDINEPNWIVIDTPINTVTEQEWARHKKIPISFEKNNQRLKLDTVTLLCVATTKVDASAQALMYSCRGIDFKAVKLVSPYRPSFLPKEMQWEYIEPFSSVQDWCHEITYNLHRYFDTDRVILIHSDGFIVNPKSWTDDFLKYDFIGSPYSFEFANKIKRNAKEAYRVGNSVSIRSRKLCKLPCEIGLQWRMIDGNYNEDVLVSIHARDLFEQHGIKYPPLELACKWGRETEFEENRHITHPFIFHRYNGKNSQYPKF